MFYRILIFTLCMSIPFIGNADVLKLRDDAPKSYVVKKGDTLWDISGRFLAKPWLWPKLWNLNPDIKNPHLIYPGDELTIIYDANGQPMLVKGKPVIKWSPKIRSTLKQDNAIRAIPLDKLAPYLTNEQVMGDDLLAGLPYVLGSDENYKTSIDGVKLYINNQLQLGRNYALYTKNEALIDPQTLENLGYEVELLGTGKAVVEGDLSKKVPATLKLNNVLREVRAGAKVALIDENALMPAYFNLQAAKSGIRGQIIKATNDGREFGKFDVVFLNRGGSNDLIIGDVLSITRKSPAVVDSIGGPKYKEDSSKLNRLASDNDLESGWNMPEETIGQLMVFKVYDKVSMAIILTSEKSVKIGDVFTSPR